MKIYTVLLAGSQYDEIYEELTYAGTDLEVAEYHIRNPKIKQLNNGGAIYAYLETWENNLKIDSKEIEL